MLNSAWHPDVHDAFMSARADSAKVFPSPADWRDHWIYFLLLDRFNNPDAPPRSLPWDSAQNTFQGGTFKGVAAQLDYLKSLGVGGAPNVNCR